MPPNADPQRSLQVAINELNNLLQVAEESVSCLNTLCGSHPNAPKYFNFLRHSLERANCLAKELVNLAEGRDSRPGPEPISPPIPVAPPQAGIEIANPSGTRELIMLIDDEPLVNTLASEILLKEGYRIVAETCPFRAIECYKQLGDQIHLVILDFTIPILNGEDVFHELQKIRPSVGVLLSSGYTEQSVIGKMLARGLRGFLPKPYTPERLLKQVRLTLDSMPRVGNHEGRMGR